MHISTAFDSGAIEVVSLADTGDIQLRVRRDSAAEFAQWFHFRLQGAKGLPVVLRFLNAGQCAYPKGWEGYRVVASYDRKHWFRAKFFQQYRLFFRYHAPSKVIVFAWVNDEATKRAYESADDAYRVFRRMLDSGRPPSDWDELLVEARAESQRLGRLASGGTRAGS